MNRVITRKKPIYFKIAMGFLLLSALPVGLFTGPFVIVYILVAGIALTIPAAIIAGISALLYRRKHGEYREDTDFRNINQAEGTEFKSRGGVAFGKSLSNRVHIDAKARKLLLHISDEEAYVCTFGEIKNINIKWIDKYDKQGRHSYKDIKMVFTSSCVNHPTIQVEMPSYPYAEEWQQRLINIIDSEITEDKAIFPTTH